MPLTKKRDMPQGSAISDNLLLWNHLPSFESFSVLATENRKFEQQLKESHPIMRDEPSLNRDIRSTPIYLFSRVQLRLTPLVGSLIPGFF